MKEGWKMVKLGKIVKLIADGDWIESKDQSHEGIRLIQTGNIGVGFFKDKSDSCRYISESTFNKLKCTEIFEGDCLVSRLPDPVGRACIIPCTNTRMITAVDCSILRFDNSVLPRWFVFYSQSKEYFNKVDKESTGSTRKRISRKNLSQIEIPLPPLEEQHRIVSILDASFEKIDALKKNAEENLKNAKALFQQVLAQELKPKEGWRKYILENICTNIVDCPHSTPQKSDEITNYPCIRTSELRNGKIYWDSMQYLDKYEYEKRVVRLIPKAGDIVYGREGTFGDAVLLPDGYNFSLGQRTMLLRPDTTIVCSEFLLITMISPYVYKQAKDKNSGCGVGHVNVKDIKKFTIYLPDDISEQHRIVCTLDTLSEKCRRLEEVAQQTICECDALKQSILRQAFSGEL